MDVRLLVFCKAPLPGTVKTRLAAGIGAQNALDAYRAMVADVLAAADASGLADSVRASRLLLGGAAWGICLVGIVFGLAMAFLLGGPVRRCAFFAKDLADGRVTGTLAVSCRDEVGQLAGSLREMARRLGKRLAR